MELYTYTYKQKRKRERTPAEIKIGHGKLNRTKNSQTQILKLKRTTTFSKQLPLYNLKAIQEQTILLTEDDVKSQKHV